MIERAWTLIRLEWRLEFRQRATLAGVVLFALGTVYLFSLAFGQLEARLWNALFWIVLLFAATNTVAAAFRRELTYRYAYYHQFAPPLSLYLAKVVYHTLVLTVLGVLVWLALGLVFGNPVRDVGLFALTLGLASLGLSLVLTFLSLLAARVERGPGLIAILAFPVSIPILLTSIKLGAVATRVIQQLSTSRDVLTLCGIDLLAVGMSVFLVPLLWQEA